MFVIIGHIYFVSSKYTVHAIDYLLIALAQFSKVFHTARLNVIIDTCSFLPTVLNIRLFCLPFQVCKLPYRWCFETMKENLLKAFGYPLQSHTHNSLFQKAKAKLSSQLFRFETGFCLSYFPSVFIIY